MRKMRVGWFTFTCCEDSTVIFIELLNRYWQEWLPNIEFIHAKVLKSKNEYAPMDVAFVEGAIATADQEERLKKIRSLATKLVAIGACANTGMPSSQRNSFSPDTIEIIRPYLHVAHQTDKIRTLKEIVPVDEAVQGCPMVETVFINVLNKYLAEFTNN